MKKKSVKTEFRKTLGTLIIAAFGLVAALAWNETMKLIFFRIFGEESSIIGMVVYALIVTLVAVIVSMYLSKLVK